ncbi:hypothetical protein Lfu02_07010 [Longispora fulva]|uniref:DUF4386 family protein n=1 Tax=Longispora fulva TaxID=619741 RepID=A0A8J7GG66_9ACTN|nr:hypothetical protein [Longispora fulva]MBG6135428.1 hypothetical protein [Longispora fulva]GIG56329.1 hypothetical protein Lfu02_07010 [Longispora fulva]
MTTPRDTRTVRRVGAAVLLPLGPLSIAVLRGVLPYFGTGDDQETITATAAHLGRQDAVLWLSVLALVTLIPSVLAAGRLAQRRAPALTLAGLVLLVPAFAALPFFAVDPTVRVLASGTVDPRTAATLLTELSGLAPVAVAGVIFVAGHVVGMVLLGAALWRSGAVPAWAAVAVLVSQPLHAVCTAAGFQLLDACAWGLTALGFAVAAWRVLRTPDDAWDLGPTVAVPVRRTS